LEFPEKTTSLLKEISILGSTYCTYIGKVLSHTPARELQRDKGKAQVMACLLIAMLTLLSFWHVMLGT